MKLSRGGERGANLQTSARHRPRRMARHAWPAARGPFGEPPLSPRLSEIDRVFKALADPGRRRLLDLLHEENGQTLTALCEHMDMTRQAVTQHLQLLEDANLVAVVWHGREKLHYLNPVPLFEIHERWIRKFERNRLGALRDLKKSLERDDDDQA